MQSLLRSFPYRYLVAIGFFFGFLNVYVTRINFSMAIVAMTSNVSKTDSNGTVTYAKDFDWNSKEQGWVMGAFFWGYVSTQMIGGFTARIIGAGRLCGIGIFGCGLLTLLTPMLAHYGTIPLVIARGLIGVFQVRFEYLIAVVQKMKSYDGMSFARVSYSLLLWIFGATGHHRWNQRG